MPNGKWWPVWDYLTGAQQTQIKAEVLYMNHIPVANEVATTWTIATSRQDTWDLVSKIMQMFRENLLKGQTKTPSKAGKGKRKAAFDLDSDVVDLSTETAEAEQALQAVGVDPKQKKTGKKSKSKRLPRSAANTLSVGQPAQPIQQAIVKELEKKEVSMSLFHNMLGFNSNIEIDYLNSILRKITNIEISIPEAGDIMKKFKAQRNVQAWIVSQSGVADWDAFETKYGELWSSQESIERCIKAVKAGKSGRGGSVQQIPKSIIQYVSDANTWLERCVAGAGDLEKLPLQYTSAEIQVSDRDCTPFCITVSKKLTTTEFYIV